MNNNTCCFTGHRRLPAEKMQSIAKRLDAEIDRLIRLGVTDFLSGGALGFDQTAAAVIVAKRESGHDIRLIFALPCRNHDERWTHEQKRLWSALLLKADEIRYLSEEYSYGCMKKRNRYMVENSQYCVCALLYGRSGTAQTVRYARHRGLEVVNVAK